MPDNCWIQITFRRDELEKFENVLGRKFWNYDDNNDKEPFCAVIEEANYGMYDEREELAEVGLTFHGNHGAGGGFGDCVFACFEGEHVEASADYDGRPVAAVLKDGKLSKADMKSATEYWEIYKLAEEHIERKSTNANKTD